MVTPPNTASPDFTPLRFAKQVKVPLEGQRRRATCSRKRNLALMRLCARGDALDVLDRLVENESVNLVSAASIQHRHELRRVSGQMAWQIVLWIAMVQQENCTKKLPMS